MKILFVCTANICRSFMAERIFRKMLEEGGRHDVEVSSASILDMEGTPPDPVAVEILEAQGYEADNHTSRYLTEEMVVAADKIVVMERRHTEIIIERFEGVEEKIFLLKPFAGGCEQSNNEDTDDIYDPHNLSLYFYRLCFAEMYLALDGLLKCI